MGGYIRMDKDLEDDPRVLALADRIAQELKQLVELATDRDLESAIRGLSRNAALGALYRLWRYGDTHLGRHNRLKGALHGGARISEVTALPAGVLREFPVEWLRVHEDGTVELPDYAAKNALIDRDMRREKTRERVRKHRAKKRGEPVDNAARGNGPERVTSEALQRSLSVTTGTGTGTGTGPVPTGTGTVPASASPPGPRAPAPRKSYEQEFRERFGVDPVSHAAKGNA